MRRRRPILVMLDVERHLMRHAWTALIAICFLAACAPKPAATSPDNFTKADWALMSMKTSAATQVETNLAGRWIRVGNDQQFPRVEVRTPSCEKGITFMVIAQRGNVVRMKLYNRLPRIAYDEDVIVDSGEVTNGTINGDQLTLRGTYTVYTEYDYDDWDEASKAVQYELRIEQAGLGSLKRPHLVGTRDGDPIRFAPLTLAGESDCRDDE